MKEITDQRLLDAIKELEGWIARRCRRAELNLEKRQELIQDVWMNLYMVSDSFDVSTIEKPIGWVKKVTTNVVGKYIEKEKDNSERREDIEFALKVSHETNYASPEAESKTDFDRVVNFVNLNFNSKDREIITLYIMKEPYKEIAEIVGMTSESIANRIVILKKRINKFMNKGDNGE